MNKFERKVSLNSAVLHIQCYNQDLNCSIFCKVDDDLVTLFVVTLTCPWFKTRGPCSEILLRPQTTAAQDSSLYTQRCGSGLCVLSRVNWTLSCSNKCIGLTASVWCSCWELKSVLGGQVQNQSEKHSSMQWAGVASWFPPYKSFVLEFHWQEEMCFLLSISSAGPLHVNSEKLHYYSFHLLLEILKIPDWSNVFNNLVKIKWKTLNCQN